MKILVHDLNSGWCCEIEIDSRPNVGDGIYLSDFDELDIKFDNRYETSREKVQEWRLLALKEIEDTTRFVVSDVVFGKLFGYEQMIWIIQGKLQP